MVMSLLERIEQPSDLDHLSHGELESLCDEIRAFLLDKISKTKTNQEFLDSMNT